MKIIIHVSGELRTYKKDDNMLDNFVKFLMYHGCEVTVVGHTWDHCFEDTHLDLLNDFDIFDDLIIEDQKVIDEWIMEDLYNRRIILVNGEDSPPIKNIQQLRNHATRQSGKLLGQVWSGFSSFEHFGPKHPEVDFHFRWRWDGTFNIKESQFDSQMSYYVFRQIIRCHNDRMNEPYIFTGNMGTLWKNVYPFSGLLMYTGTVEDKFFALNRLAMKKILEIPFRNRLHDTLSPHVQTKTATPSAHSLWWDVLTRKSDIPFEIRFDTYVHFGILNQKDTIE